MLCPNTQAVINGYMQPFGVLDHFSQNVLKFGFRDGKNVYMKKGVNLHLSMGNFVRLKDVPRGN